ncbi:NAD(P)-dependent oxidoreductase [Nocardia sp. XZ_19_231]|uniref:NAD(P)-dependent oxidoreductase n=1 Tax=Nocardia sp. XZ_19_231 TaxID=2769252 RepID=UPI00188E3DBD|nr:NAD(P)-binding domain-containing protein [Nocardia sp. XZ_19_231]
MGQASVGFVGAGRIGAPMVERLLAAGHRVSLFTRRAEIGAELAAAGAELVPDVREIGQSDVVVSCLYSDVQVLEVLPEVVGAMESNSVLVSHTTGAPDTLRRLDEFARTGRAAVVDAAFSGTPDAVRAGSLVVYLGGDAHHVGTVREVIGAYAGTVIPTGGRGSAMLVKLLNNVLFAAISQVTLLGIAGARELGIEESSLLEALGVSSGGSTAGRYIAARGGSEQYSDSVIPFLRKDLAACREVAAVSGIDLTALLRVAGEGPMNLGDITSMDKGVTR